MDSPESFPSACGYMESDRASPGYIFYGFAESFGDCGKGRRKRSTGKIFDLPGEAEF